MSTRPTTGPGSAPKIHDTPAETRERTYDRLRSEGFTRDVSRQIADEVGRRVHTDRRDR